MGLDRFKLALFTVSYKFLLGAAYSKREKGDQREDRTKVFIKNIFGNKRSNRGGGTYVVGKMKPLINETETFYLDII